MRVSAGDMQRALDALAFTVSHHLVKVARVGLVEQVRWDREIYGGVYFDEMRALISFLTKECCIGVIMKRDDTQSVA